MIVTLGNLYYYPLKLYVFIASYLYFRKLRVKGRSNIPKEGPVIFAINHQNALLDALLISALVWRNTHFLTRADVFKRKFIAKFLQGLKMLPIYRIRDGYDSIKMNEEIFDATSKILHRGGVVGIFPEGSHSLLYRVRPLKKGVARIAFKAEEEANYGLNLQIVPVGIQFESHFMPEGRVLVNIGKPIPMLRFVDTYRKNSNKGIDEMIAVVREEMKSLVLHFEDLEGYEENLQRFNEQRIYKKRLDEQLQADQALARAIEHDMPFLDSSDKKNSVTKLVGQVWRFVWSMIGFVPRRFVDWLVAKTVKDEHFNGTMRFGYSIFLYPIFLFVVFLIFRAIF